MHKLIKAGLSILLCQAVGITSAVFTQHAIPDWYMKLNKPFFSPPNWVFAPVWTLLYFLMGVSLYLVIMTKAPKKQKRSAYFMFAAQLLLNFLWTMVFFGLQSPLLGIFAVLSLWLSIALTMRAFHVISKRAAQLLLPYLAWVSFATLLNCAVAWLN